MDWDDDDWWYDKEWAVYGWDVCDYDGWKWVFVGYCYGEHEARFYERHGYYVFEPRRSWW